MRRLGWLLGTVTLVACGIYSVVYVYRWEWNRALLVGLLFIAIEVAMALLLVLRRIERLKVSTAVDREHGALEQIRATRPDRDHFAWLERDLSQLSVFVTVLLGAGVLLTIGAWLVDRIASRTALPTLEESLARRLDQVRFPDRPLVPDDRELVAESGPYGIEHLEVLLGPRR
jgi:hypothetical protein